MLKKTFARRKISFSMTYISVPFPEELQIETNV